MSTLYRLQKGNVTAGVVVSNQKVVIRTAPILRWALHLTIYELEQQAIRRGYFIKAVREEAG